MSASAQKSGRGCFFYGCLTSLIFLILFAVGGYFGVRWYFNQQVLRLTEAQPMALPKTSFTPDEAKAVRERVDAFSKAVEAGEPVEPLTLDGRELNLLLASVPELKPIRDHVHLSIRSNMIQGAISLPVEIIPFSWLQKFKGRYLNGAAGLRASLTNGFFNVTLQSLELKQQPVPPQVLAPLQQQNLAKEFYKNPEGMAELQKLESIAVVDDRLVIRARNSQ